MMTRLAPPPLRCAGQHAVAAVQWTPAGDADDLRRILAIRIAVVSRSAERSDQGCSSAMPTWRAANEATGLMEDTPIAVNIIQDWACYRYRVLQAEIPLRNLIWSDS
jgi:type IV pilus assembly protein PilW